jgi:hypothetical protein
VDPQDLIEKYGADTARLYTMFTSPPEATLEWNDAGVEGSYRFLRRVWNFGYKLSALDLAGAHVTLAADGGLAAVAFSKEAKVLRLEMHTVLKQVDYDYQRMQYNTVVSGTMKMLNALEDFKGHDTRDGQVALAEGFGMLLRVLYPATPHVAHALWVELGFAKQGGDLLDAAWPVVDAIVGLACAPVQGVQIDFTDPTYNAASAVVKAAVYGHCSFAEASAILAERLDAAANIEAIEKIRGAMDSLKTAGETAVHSATGTFLFVWAKVSNVISKRADFTYKLEAAAKSKSAVHSVTLVRPETEAEFYEMTHLFIMTVIALGLASATIVIKFIDDVVFGTVRMREPFTVAHELVVCYFREMDFDPARVLHMGNVFRRGGQDTLLSEARRNAAAFFRAGGGILQPKGNNDDKLGNVKTIKNTKPNGKSDESSKKPCPDFNGGRPCKNLKPDGTCTFAHKCNQFVSDKMPLDPNS